MKDNQAKHKTLSDKNALAHKLQNSPEYRGPSTPSVKVKYERPVVRQTNAKDSRDHKNDLYFLDKLMRNMGVKL